MNFISIKDLHLKHTFIVMFSLFVELTFNTNPFDGTFFIVDDLLLCVDDISTLSAIRLCRPIDSGNKQYHLYLVEF